MMRHAAIELRSVVASILRAIDVEGALILGSIAILAWIAWTVDPRLAGAVVALAMLALGILFARPPSAAP